MKKRNAPDMPDIASSQRPQHNGTLNWVGMNRIALPIQFHDALLGPTQVNGFAQSYVNLSNPQVKGIHMSRLYLLLADFARNQVLTAADLRGFLKNMLNSHEDISDQTSLYIEFDYVIERAALKSEFSGFKDYPAGIKATLLAGGQVELELAVKIPYSSTCPCSAALARQLIQEAFQQDFASSKDLIKREDIEAWLRSEKGTFATPHSQRSIAHVWVKLDGGLDEFPLSQLIDVVEQALQTPVQTAVKREDEQEFARLNGQNLMFCEDAARRLKSALNQQNKVFTDFWLRVDHLESLHAHDAVAIATKGVTNGYQPLFNR